MGICKGRRSIPTHDDTETNSCNIVQECQLKHTVIITNLTVVGSGPISTPAIAEDQFSQMMVLKQIGKRKKIHVACTEAGDSLFSRRCLTEVVFPILCTKQISDKICPAAQECKAMSFNLLSIDPNGKYKYMSLKKIMP